MFEHVVYDLRRIGLRTVGIPGGVEGIAKQCSYYYSHLLTSEYGAICLVCIYLLHYCTVYLVQSKKYERDMKYIDPELVYNAINLERMISRYSIRTCLCPISTTIFNIGILIVDGIS